MNTLKVSKLLDGIALVAIVIILAVYLFMHLSFVPLACMLMGVCIIKMIAQMLKANFYQSKYKEIEQEHYLYKAKSESLEKELNVLKSKQINSDNISQSQNI